MISNYSTLAGALDPYTRGQPESTVSTTIRSRDMEVQHTIYNPQHHHSNFSTLRDVLG